MKKICAIILAGGKGERFGANIPKQFISLNGKPVITYSYDTFLKHPDISRIVISTHSDWIHEVKKYCPDAVIVKGGESRQESSYNALKACDEDTDYVLIHDAVRPFVDFKIINRCIRALEDGYIAVDTIIPCHDTIVRINKDSLIEDMPDRSILYRGQTPQAFNFRNIYEAYIHPKTSVISPTDDIRLLYNIGEKCYCVEGSEFNIKITTVSDLYLAERISQYLFDARTGNTDLTGKKVIVFGANGGIGNVLVNAFTDSGAKVYPMTLDKLNLLDFEKYDSCFNRIRSEFGVADILVNAAGYMSRNYLLNMDHKTISDIIDINLKASVEITRCAVKSVLKRGSRIFLIGSSSWSQGRQEYSVYSASKAALVNFVQAMAQELCELEIKINCINPPRTNTEMRRKAFPGEDASTLMEPIVVAKEIIKYSQSPESGYVIDLKIGLND